MKRRFNLGDFVKTADKTVIFRKLSVQIGLTSCTALQKKTMRKKSIDHITILL